VSSLRRGHANLLCIVPILSYETGVTPLGIYVEIRLFCTVGSIEKKKKKKKKEQKESPRERLELSTYRLTAGRAANCAIQEMTILTRTR
jgi:hypothetical protein